MKLGKLFKAAIGVVTIPLDVVKDIVTIGGVVTEKRSTYTQEKIEEIADNLDEASE